MLDLQWAFVFWVVRKCIQKNVCMNNAESIMNIIILIRSRHIFNSLRDVHDMNAYFGDHACLKAKTDQQQYIKFGVWDLAW